MTSKERCGRSIGPRVLVTGGAGFFGRVLTRRLLDEGLSVRVLDVRSHPDLDPRTELVLGDLCDRDTLARAVQDCATVFHVAAIINLCGVASERVRRRSYDVNVQGTKDLLDACIAVGVLRFVYTSSNNVVVDHAITDGDESAPYAVQPVDLYTQTKILAEQHVLAAGKHGAIRTCAIRPGGIWGPGAGGLVMDNVLDTLAKGLLVARIGECAPSDNTHVENLARAQILAAHALEEKPELVNGEAYFVTDGEPKDPLEWFAPLLDELGAVVPTRSVPTRLMYALSYVSEWVARWTDSSPVFTRAGVLKATRAHSFRIDKARAHLGYVPIVTSERGLRGCVPSARAYIAERRSRRASPRALS